MLLEQKEFTESASDKRDKKLLAALSTRATVPIKQQSVDNWWKTDQENKQAIHRGKK